MESTKQAKLQHIYGIWIYVVVIAGGWTFSTLGPI